MDAPTKPIKDSLFHDIAAFLARIASGGSRLSPEAKELLGRLDPTRAKKS